MQAMEMIDIILKYSDFSDKQKEFLKSKLYKYHNDPVVSTVCNIIEQHKDQVEVLFNVLSECSDAIINGNTSSFFILCPDKPDHLRIYPYIPINSFSIGVKDLSPLTCTSYLKDFIKEYEADMESPERRLKWESKERITDRLNKFIDMPTAKGLTSALANGKELKSNILRDLADRIDSCRKPMELTFAETPKDFTIMYGSGPHSCMAFSAEGRKNWEFFGKKMSPPSFYSYWPNTGGVFVMKGGSVVARCVLFRHSPEDKWMHGRVYANTPEINTKFTRALLEQGIKALPNMFEPKKGTSCVISGIPLGTNGVFACPWPYMDNMSGGAFFVKYDDKTHEFTLTYGDSKAGLPVNNRTGHLRSNDYAVINCSNCGKIINTRQMAINECEDPEVTLCSDKCSLESGYLKLIQGNGVVKYMHPKQEYIDSDVGFIKFSTLRAAQDQGYSPKIDELGVFPEDGAVVAIVRHATVKDASGQHYSVSLDNCTGNNGLDQIIPTKVPIGGIKVQKTVEWRDEDSLVRVI